MAMTAKIDDANPFLFHLITLHSRSAKRPAATSRSNLSIPERSIQASVRYEVFDKFPLYAVEECNAVQKQLPYRIKKVKPIAQR